MAAEEAPVSVAPREPSKLDVLDFLRRAMQNRVVVKLKVFSLRNNVPRVVAKHAFFIDEFDIVLTENLPNHIRMLRATQGAARGLIPATKELYDVLNTAGITTEKVKDEAEKYAIIPGRHIKQLLAASAALCMKKDRHAAHVAELAARKPATVAPLLAPNNTRTLHSDDEPESAHSDDDEEFDLDTEPERTFMPLSEIIVDPLFSQVDAAFALIGRAKRKPRDDPAVILSLAEASLKSRVHASQMSNALVRRISALVDTDIYDVLRRGDNSVHIQVRHTVPLSVDQCLKEHPLDIKVLALVPGVAKLYDPTQPPKKVREAKLEMRAIDTQRILRKSQGLPADETIPPESAQLDSRGRPILNPTAYRYGVLQSITEMERKREQSRVVYGEVICEGAGGLPVQNMTRALCLLSGGIDSPVAAYNMMQRGCNVDLVHFLNSTSDTAAILKKLYLIAKRLSIVQGRIDLLIVDIAELQQSIVGVVQRLDRTVVYKQYMLLCAAAIPGYSLLVTGDSVAQVASQTAHNIATLYPHTPRAVISPLSGTNKQAIMDTSDRLGLLDLSTMEGADCCQYLMCKTGANLCIGAGKMKGYVAKIVVPDIPVKVVVFENGAEVPSAARTMTIPFDSITINTSVPLRDLAATFLPRASVRARMASAAAASANELTDDTLDQSTDTVAARRQHADPEALLAASRLPKSIYLDSAAATIIDPTVIDAIARCPVGNPNSVHNVGRVCKAAVEGVRHQLLSYICPTSAVPFQLVFTSGGTEANNIGLQGLARLLRRSATPETAAAVAAAGRQARTCILYSSIAHPSVTEVAMMLVKAGIIDDAVAIPVHADGSLSLDALTMELDTRSNFRGGAAPNNACAVTGLRPPLDVPAEPWANVLVAVDLVNHELGTVRDAATITRLARAYGALLHVDACQGLCKVDFDGSLFDSVSVTAHKINGPIGVGAIAVRSSLAKFMPTLMAGGSYDGGLRPGTLNAPGIVGFGAALSLPRGDEDATAEVFRELIAGAQAIPGVRVNTNPAQCSNRIAHMTLVGAPPDVAALSDLEIVSVFAARYSIMLSTGAACSQSKGAEKGTRANDALYRALGISAGVTLRISIDHATAMYEVNSFLRALREVMRA